MAAISYFPLTLKFFKPRCLVYICCSKSIYILLFHRLFLAAMVGDGIKPTKFFHLMLFCLCATENTILKYTLSFNTWVIFSYHSVLCVKYRFEINPRWEHGYKAKSESEVYILLAWFFFCFVWFICFHLYCHVLLWRQWPHLVSSTAITREVLILVTLFEGCFCALCLYTTITGRTAVKMVVY